MTLEQEGLGGHTSTTSVTAGARDHAKVGTTDLHAHGPLDEARFAPGHIFGARYRIVSLLGRGAMGEVYRAALRG